MKKNKCSVLYNEALTNANTIGFFLKASVTATLVLVDEVKANLIGATGVRITLIDV